MMKQNALFIFLLLVIFSCSIKNKNTQSIKDESLITYFETNKKYKKQLVETAEKAFPLDSVSQYVNQMFSFHEIKDSLYLSFLNEYNNTIYLYNYETEKLYKKINFPKEGPNSSPKMTGYYIHNFDSIFTFRYIVGSIRLFNKNKELIKKLNTGQFINDKINENFPVLDISILNHSYYINDHIYLTGYLKGTDKTNIHAKINLQTDSISYHLNYPTKHYKREGIVHPDYYKFYHTYNPNTKKFYYSFKADFEIYESSLKLDGFDTSYFAGSDYFDEFSIDYNLDRWRIEGDRQKTYYTTPEYEGIVYDKYRNIYYRYAYLPKSIEEYKNVNKNKFKTPSIIVLDENFNKICETLLPTNEYTPQISFVSPDGLCVGKFEKSMDNEDFMYFAILNLVDNNEK